MNRRICLAVLLAFTWCFLQLSLLAGPAAAGSTATFNTPDTTTEGNWQGAYGTDGSALATLSQNYPAYASVAMQGEITYVWNPNTPDVRALQTSNGRIAAAWYSSAPFSFSINFSDTNTHKVSLYLLDWDNSGRTETIKVYDPSNLNTPIDTEFATGYANGTYLSWNITGNVIIIVTGTAGPNGVVSGLFFDPISGGGGGPKESITLSPQTIGVAAGGTQQFTATVNNNANPGQALNWSISSFTPSRASSIGTISSTGLYTAPSAGPSMANQVIIKVATADTLASATSTINLSAGSAANFVGFDTQTQGSWQGVYGTDGYDIQDVNPNLPPYAAFSVIDSLTYIWSGSTSDVRALVVPGGSSRVAACWYSIHDNIPPVFSMDINLTDGATHQVAFYALDFDGGGRAESVQIVDAVTNTQLSFQTVSNFSSGTYLVYQITGHVIVNVTQTVGANSVISAVFFGANSASVINVTVAPTSVNLSATQTQQFTATVTGATNPGVNWSLTPSTGAGTISTAGLYSAPSTPSNQTVSVIATSQQDGTRSGSATVNLTTNGVANFQATDTSTQGAWQGVYGGDGYTLAGDPPDKFPTYAAVTVQNGFVYTWVPAPATDPRDLQEVSGNGRIAATWYGGSFSFNVNVSDGELHQFALYALDWDARGRIETVQITNQQGTVLDTRTLSNFSGGAYLVWNVTGNITVTVTGTAGPNGVVSGLFFGGGTGGGVSVSPPAAVLDAGQTQQFSASIPNGGGQTFTWSLNPSTGEGTISPTGFYTAPTSIPTSQTVTVIATASGGTVGQATITLAAGATASAATFDTTTQGNWVGQYGSAGYSLAGDNQSLPSWATFNVSNYNAIWTWTINTTDPRALTAVSYAGKIAAAWYKNHESFTMAVNITDGKPHQISLYALDWDGQGRAESIVVLDPSNNHVLDTEQLSNFVNGTYATWTITGNVTFNITVTSGANSVISGVFFK